MRMPEGVSNTIVVWPEYLYHAKESLSVSFPALSTTVMYITEAYQEYLRETRIVFQPSLCMYPFRLAQMDTCFFSQLSSTAL